MTFAKGHSGNPRGRRPAPRIITDVSTCAACRETKPASAFTNEPRKLNGRSSYCNACKKLKVDDWRSRNRETAREAARQYRRKDPASYLFYRIRLRAKKYNIPFTLTVQDVVELVDATPICPVFGTPLKFYISAESGQKMGPRDDSYSFDRLIPALGYVKGNVSIISNRANALKNNASLDELRTLVKWIEQQLRDIS